jgi:uncharacterized delta-60 repeat protein
VKDLAGNAMLADRVWSFTTRSPPDVTPPSVQSTSPPDGATEVSTTALVTATFSEAIDPSSVDATTFQVLDGALSPVAGAVSAAGSTATFTPSTPLVRGALFTATLGPAIRDLAGNPMAAPVAWSFRTVPPAAGSLDPSFGTGGVTFTDVSGTNDVAVSVLVQPGGRVLVGAITASGLGSALLGYGTDGSLDPSFGTDGRVDGAVFPEALALLPGGGLLVGGGVYLGKLEFAVARCSADGVPDSTFGAYGLASVAVVPYADALVRALGIQSSGDIVAAGTTPTGGAIVRFHADGTQDLLFGGGGVVSTPLDLRALAIQPDDRIVVAGTQGSSPGSSMAASRYLADGSPDPGFGSGGTASTYLGMGGSSGVALALQADGSVLVAGSSSASLFTNSDFALIKYTSDGVLDAAFGAGGTVTTDFGGRSEGARGMAVQGDGKIVLAGTSMESVGSAGSDVALVRYWPEGTLDATFGTGGEVLTDLGTPNDSANAIALQPDGRILVVGSGYFAPGGYDVAILRYWP